MTQPASASRKLRILHVLRAPLGGLFRHVVDLTREQIERGHAVGLVTDSRTGGRRADETLDALTPSLELGLLRIPMQRPAHILDIPAALRVAAHANALNVDVVHGHGSKGGAYARLPAVLSRADKPVRAYTPHGGSFNYRSGPLIERTYMAIERLLVAGTDVYLFESGYIAQQFRRRVGPTTKLTRIVYNGLSPNEFVPVAPNADAADFLYVGELRAAKGIDTLIDAIALISQGPIKPRLVLVGSGPDDAKLIEHAVQRGIGEQVTFAGVMPAHEAFRLGRVLVVPSRAESLPYIVLEAAAAEVPLVATDVGGINEIFGPYRDRLIVPDDPQLLAATLKKTLTRPADQVRAESRALADFVKTKFKISDMADAVIAGYAEALAARRSRRSPANSSVVPSS
ncbi:glycosyltransferase family 1 protein [Methylovirgula ligni]|uniref:Glycosyltransferase involved in cell wall biosynthesis n=1 Tax=Methylovirgula ligni TaxID=569860 RepID=A0A3D9YTM6_9HYPH|nr:glycosyltransferase family 1 protein [Methylovirgula ligni]REF85960.1 glycosyltransferase involved in cell wall biosynthesis [Methylovirgula ligni]